MAEEKDKFTQDSPDAAGAASMPDDPEVVEVANSVLPADEYAEGQDVELKERLNEDGDPVPSDDAVVDIIAATEEASEESPVARGWDQAITSIERTIETVGAPPTTVEEAQAPAHHGDTTTILGRTYNIPEYTAVFGALAVLTALEVLIAEVISSGIKAPLLLGIALVKAALVILFYMHLKNDSRIFALTLALPLIVATISMLYLLMVPPVGY